MERPTIAVAIGDPAGIGPEVALKAALDPRVRDACRPVIVGDIRVLALHAKQCGIAVEMIPVERPDGGGTASGAVPVVDIPNVDVGGDFALGRVDPACGRAILDYAGRAVALALDGAVDAVVAAPQTQKAIEAAGIAFDGYPGFVAQCTGTDPDDVFLMLVSDTMRIAHVTLHVGLRRALEMIDRPRILRALRATHAALRRLGIASPRIAVAGINPHAGEGGLFGREEIEIVAPALADAKSEGIDAGGPFGADTMYLADGYDAFLVMYHDQGHVPAKLVGFDRTAAFTIGTPVLFASVAHGSAHDIAGKGVADPGCLIQALLAMRRAAVVAAA